MNTRHHLDLLNKRNIMFRFPKLTFRVKFVKYPPFSWLRLGDEVRQSPSRIWFSFNHLPNQQESCKVKIHIGDSATSYGDPFDAVLNNNVLLPRQQKVLELFLKLAKPTKSKTEFLVDHDCFSKILHYAAAIPFEVEGLGIINYAKQNARIKASIITPNEEKPLEKAIDFCLMKGSMERIKNPKFFGDVNAYVIDEQAKLHMIVPYITQNEARAILNSPPLPLLGLCQKESRQMFYALARLGIDFSCLHDLSLEPASQKIVLRLLLNIDDVTKKMCARAHLVTQINHGDFSDEVEIKATGSIPSVHIAASSDLDEEKYVDQISSPELLRRSFKNESDARQFLFQLGAGPARLHDGFEFKGAQAFELLKTISQKDKLPPYMKLDEHAHPEIIELNDKPILKIKAEGKTPTRVDVALSLGKKFDEKGACFELLSKAKDNILVLDEDTLVVFNANVSTSVQYFSKIFGLDSPNEFKSKPIAQVALLLNALCNQVILEADEDLKNYMENFSVTHTQEDRILPKDLRSTLRPYQHDAVAWLSSLHRSGLGGLLGDEMGLGKTVMVLTHLAKLKDAKISKAPALVVCPTSVIDVWKEEAATHIPTLKVTKWHGPDRAAKEKEALESDIVVTSYAILRRDIETFLGKNSFSSLILDEAQYVRNQQTDSFKAAKAINCRHRIALTGTPIENHVSDLYNILDCVEDSILGSRSSFEKQFSNPIEAGETNSAITLKMLLSPIVTRRRKSEVENELPPKIENIVHCKLSREQRELYKKYVGQLSGALNSDSMERSSDKNSHFTLLSALTRLRQICCHPSLILGKEASQQESGKLTALREIMAECLELDRKIIIYSQFLKMQEHIVNIASELDPKGALWLHGSTQNRDQIVKSFQNENGPRIIVVSLKAGGTGITLTQADTVIFADPWWNPAVEDQAVDRAHRIGQKKTVHVIRLIAEDSIEGEVVSLAQKKRHAAQSVLQDGFKGTANLTKEEVRGLLLKELERVKSHHISFGDDD